jgi:F0F1-type ATP synthase beta subunit
MSNQITGRVIAIVGPAVDVEFDSGLPEIMNALLTELVDGQGVKSTVTLEVQQHLGENRVRCVSMQPTEGMVRGQIVTDTGAPTPAAAAGARSCRSGSAPATAPGGRKWATSASSSMPLARSPR